MELIYVFIKDYKGIIKNKEYNFGGEFLYSYNGEILNKEINNSYFNNFFGEQINNLTAIIGQNGSGKSTLINFILDNLVSDVENSLKLKDQAIIVIKENGIYKVLAHSDMIINNKNDFNIVRYSTYKDSNKIYEHIGNDTSIVKFSNIFDLNEYNLRHGYNYLDISTNYLLKNIKNINEAEAEGENNNISQLELFKMNEIYKQIEFVYNNDIKDLVDFKLPSKIEIELNEFDYLNNLDDLDVLMEEFFNSEELYCEDANEVSINISEKIRKELNQSVKEEIFCKELLILLIENIIFTLISMKSIIVAGKRIEKDILTNVENSIIKSLYNIYSENDKIFDMLPNIFDYIKKDLENKCYKDEWGIIDTIENSKNFYKYIKEQGLKSFKDNKIILGRKEEVCEFIKFYKGVFIYVPLLNIKWREMSSGQTALLSMYSRFYYYRTSYRANNIILIDEGELYFHPEWQKKMINNLVKNLPKIMKGNKDDIKIQIICSSNSPFLISDLPKNNILFLDVNNEPCTITSDSKIINTFGANIHELLSNAFFLKNTIGEFALINIKDVARDLTEKSREEILSINGRKEKIEYIIKNIGEPVIKRKLENLYKKVFPQSREDYELQITKLQAEKAELEKRLRGKGLDKIENVMKLLDLRISELKEKAGDTI
ncbi:hypothetical protein FC820_07155 [Clostridium sporogenes]|uniref:AAA family ATPase n=1 Tax=Clostridium sporogenes TaxID=1509 RepID=UPI0013D23FBD|nr:AAA family ATPase [Clostridium sporogenes]NFE80029.1 hypothetical protein [Clostridium sporogenes]NFG68113.1 hypothetical protein [Clostridium sporogenes]